MPITIKEILNSDNMSSFVEKVNFNFDQLILAGGGPPGPPGIQGIAGPVGPQGKRGDHWFTGASALGQTADHDGISALQEQDNFLDENGDIYNYFDNGSGSTGWTFSGINLMGPTGPTGNDGGGTDWGSFLAEFPIGGTNPIGNLGYYGPKPVNGTSLTNIDFIIPYNISKNSVFLGDPTWSYDNLINFGYNFATGSANGTATPKLTIIQNEMNTGGFNGLAFGGYGLNTAPGSAPAYVSNTTKTDAKDFTYFGYRQNAFGNTGLYRSWFGIRSINSPIEINAGDQSFPTFMPVKITGNNIKIGSYEAGDSDAKIIDMISDYGFSIGAMFQNKVRGLVINAKPSINVAPIGPNWTPTDNTSVWSYVGLQNIQGAIGSTDGSFGQEHGYGTVIIGPTFNTLQGSMIGVGTPQALGISRRITLESTRDAAIRFMFDGVAGGTAGNLFASTIGTIVPIRFINEGLDALIISSGIGSNLASNRVANTGGRLGFSNNALRAFKPMIASHTRITWDDRVYGGAFGSAPSAIDVYSPWFAGWDIKHKSNLGFVGYTPKNDVGIGFATVAESFTYPGSPGGTGYYPMPLLQTYYTEDYDAVPFDQVGGRSQGIKAPHLFMQYGDESDSGNVGIGFKPDAAISSAYSKLHVNGGVVIGSTANSYHSPSTIRRANSILLEGALIQGAINFAGQYGTSIFGATATVNAYVNNYTISGNGLISGKNFLSRGFSAITFAPDFALPDLKTGMMYDPTAGYEYIGWLTSPRNLPASVGGPTAPDTTTTPKKVAKWANRGENGYNNNNEYSSFTIEETFSTRPVTVTTQGLTQKLVNSNFASGGQLICSIWEIPVKSSMIFLDLGSPRNQVSYYTGGGVGSWQGYASPGNFYLNGSSTSTSISLISAGFSLEDGHYDGQTLNLFILDVDPQNNGPLLPNRPAYTGSLPVSIPLGLEQRADNIVMAPEPMAKVDAGTINPPYSANLSMPLFSMPLFATKININGLNDAYPVPFGPAGASSQLNNGNNITSLLGATTAIAEINKNTYKWTNRTKSGQASTIAFNGSGFGTFYIIPYRSIRFVWRFDSSSGFAGKWYELGRENLVRPLVRSWDPNDYADTAAGASAGDGDVIIVDPNPTPTCCFVSGTLISMSDGTFKAIENVNPGDKILSVIDGTQEIIENEVTIRIKAIRDELYTITLDNGNIITGTDDHPIWVEDKGWSSVDPSKSAISYPSLPVVKIEVGDILFGINGNPTIVSIVDAGLKAEETYTLTTSNRNALNYIANGILAHNRAEGETPTQLLQCLADALP